MSKFLSSARDVPIFLFPDGNLSMCQGILTKLGGLGLLIGKFRRCYSYLPPTW